MMPSRRPIHVLAFAGALLAALGSPVRGQEGSPCAAGDGTLIRDWQVEGIPGTKGRLSRSSLECQSDGSIRQVVEVSKDGGQTWKVLFESVYVPRATPAPSAAAAVALTQAPSSTTPPTEPAPPAPRAESQAVAQHQAARQTTQEGSDVQALSRELERQEIPQEEAPELVMASPMVLELTPGEVDEYPEGTAWATDETAGFICGQVVIRRVTVGRKEKGGRTLLDIGASLFTTRRQRSVDLLIEVLLDGQVVASEQLRKVRLGLNIPGHGKDGFPVDAQLELPGDTFARLFADGADRKLRLTLTVPSP